MSRRSSTRPPRVSEATVELRRARRDAIVAEGRLRYPEALPITDRRDDLLAAIGGHQVVIVAGETGSGKSTQLPKLCLELGRGVDGLIGHTQPRRVAARTIALLQRPDGAFGYQVRRFVTVRTPFARWSTAWMLAALALLADATPAASEDSAVAP